MQKRISMIHRLYASPHTEGEESAAFEATTLNGRLYTIPFQCFPAYTSTEVKLRLSRQHGAGQRK